MIVGPRPRSSGQDHFAADLQQLWNQGCTDAALLHAEIAAQGSLGSKRSVRRYRQPLRATLTASGAPAAPADRPGSHPVDHQGTIRRVKALKRQMSGRPNLDLLLLD
jgi:hypothetical protein